MNKNPLDRADSPTLDPDDWAEFRAQSHKMLDDMIDYLEHIRSRPVWQPIPDAVRAHFHQDLPQEAQPLDEVHDEFMKFILPYTVGNVHPGFMGWVHGGGTPVGMLAEMLAAGLNANLGGRDHIPVEVERQITRWVGRLFEFPDTASGLFVTGTSMANLIAILVARAKFLGSSIRQNGLSENARTLRVYTSTAAHNCIAKGMEISGLGTDALRLIPTDSQDRMNLSALESAITSDRMAGLVPCMVIGTAGTVDVGAVDNLEELGEICAREKLWFHVDGAYGALGMLSPNIAPRLSGIQNADSVALDFHKWGQVPYDAGFILIRDGELHRATFSSPATYLNRLTRGLAAGQDWPCDYGPDLSRGFRALKTWFTIKNYGANRLGEMMSQTCHLAQYLERKISAEPKLELMAPAQLNIVCFRYRAEDPDPVNTNIVIQIQESGLAAPSTTVLNGKNVIRAAIFNHRSQEADMDKLVEAVLHYGGKFSA